MLFRWLDSGRLVRLIRLLPLSLLVLFFEIMESLLVPVATMSYYFSLIFYKILRGRELNELFACNVQSSVSM